jgi:hypothetical protein
MRPTSSLSIVVGICLAMTGGTSETPAADWWVVTSVDADEWTTVKATSLGVLPTDEPAISYVYNPGDWGGYDLKYACCEGTEWSLSTVEEFIGSSTGLAVLPDGEPAIAYEAEQLMYAWHDTLGWHTATIEPVTPGGGYTSLVIDLLGNPAISYARGMEPFPDHDLKYAWYDGSTWHTVLVDWVGNVGLYTSLALLPTGAPAISYFDQTNTALKYAWIEDDAWHTVVVDSDGDVGQYSSLVILPSGCPAISYYDATNTALKYAYLDEGQWETTIVDDTGSAGQYTSLAILPSGHPAISYFDGDEIRFAWYDGGVWRTSSVCESAAGGGHTSLVILPCGQPAISFYLAGPPGAYGASALAYAERLAASGDCNCDGAVDYGDIDPFVLALSGEDGYRDGFPNCDWLVADCNEDGAVDYADIDAFVELLAP